MRRMLPAGVGRQLLLPLLVALVSMSLAESVILYRWYLAQRHHEMQSSLELARATAATFEAWVEGVVQQEGALGSALQHMQQDIHMLTPIDEFLRTNAETYPAVDSFHWIEPDGTVLFSSHSVAPGASIAESPYFQEIRAGADWAISDLHRGPFHDGFTFVLARGFRDPAKQLAGVMVAVIDPAQLGPRLSKVERPQSGHITVFDRNAQLVCIEPDIEVADRKWDDNDPYLRIALDGRETQGTFVSPVDGENRFVAHALIAHTGWVSGASRSVGITLAPVMHGLTWAVSLLLSVTVVSSLLLLGVYRGILEGIRALQRHAQALSLGRLEHRVSITRVAEFQELGEGFNRMAEALGGAEQRRERHLSRLSTLIEVSLELLSEPTIPAIITRVSDAAAGLTGAALAACRHRPDTGAETLFASSQTRDAAPALDEAFNGLAATNDFTALARHAAFQSICSGPGAHSFLAGTWLLDAYGAKSGFILAGGPGGGAFTPEDRALLGQLALIASLALQHLHARIALQAAHDDLENKVQARTAELSKLNERLLEKVDAHAVAVESLRASEASLSKAQEIARLGNWDWDLAADSWHLSAEVFRILGIPPGDFAPSVAAFLSVVHPDDRVLVEQSLEESLHTAGARSVDYRIVRPSGEVRTVHGQIEVFFSPDGRPARVTGIIQDITEHVKAEEEVRLREQQLIQADKMVSLGILVSGVAHEINNPNHAILSNATALRHLWADALPVLERFYAEYGDFVLAGNDYTQWRNRVPGMIASVVENSNRIKVIVQELRDFARHSPTDRQESVDVNAVVRSAHVLVSSMAEKCTNRFVVNAAPGLPPVKGNFQRLEQVLINLIQNACQALPSRDRAISVTTRCDQGRGVVEILVSDEGTGISEEDLKHILDPFYTTKRGAGGMGLGLWITSNIVHEHGGTLTFRSRLGAGTTVSVSLPALNSPAAPGALEPSSDIRAEADV